MTNPWTNPRAFAPMLEPVLWTEDKPPHRRGTIRAAVFCGESQSSSAGPSLDGVVADPYTLKVPISDALVSQMKMGDTVKLGPRFAGAELTVQQITVTPGWIVVRCTANERAPMP